MMSNYFLYLHFVPEKKRYEERNEMEKKKINRLLMRKSSLEKTTLVSYKRKGVETPRDVLAGKEPPRCLLKKIHLVNCEV